MPFTPDTLSSRALLLIAALSPAATASAQQSPTPIAETEIVVTASRTARPLSQIPNTVTVIDQQALAQQISIANDMSTILGNMLPSFSPSRQKLSSAGESLRGRNPMYMVDGVPQSNPLRDGSRDGHTIDPLMLERVEVIHGANAIHGLGAAGGIINMITRDPSGEFRQSLRLEGNAQGEDIGESLGYGGTYSVSGDFGAMDVLASLGYRRAGVGYDANGQVIGFDNTQGDTMDSSMVNGFLKTGYDWDDQRLELTLNRYDLSNDNDWRTVPGDASAGIPTTAEKGDVEGDAPGNEITMLSVNYHNDAFLGHSLDIQGFDQDFTATYGGGRFGTFQDPAFGENLFDQSANNSEKQGLKITLVRDGIAGTPVNLVYGLDVFSDTTYQELVQTGRKWVPATEYINYAPFLQLETQVTDRLNLTGGIRHEESRLEVDDFTTLASYGSQFVEGGRPEFNETLFNAGGVYRFTPSWRLFANYSESFSMPDVGRVLRGINIPDQRVESFLDLTPITTDNVELGIEYDTARFSTQLSYYTSESDFGQRLQANADGIFSVKREQTEIDGIEVRSDWVVSANDVLGLRYATADGEYDADGDGRVDTDLDGTNIAPDRINLSWDRAWSDSFTTRLQVNHLRDRNFHDRNGARYDTFDGYTTADLTGDIAVLQGTLSVSVRNLTNTDYVTYYSQAADNDVRYFTGLGRTVSVSWNRQF